MKYTLDKIVRNFALGGLAATIIACGGGNPPVLASEADGRAQIRVKLVADMNAGRIADWEEDPDFEPEPGKPVFADFKVIQNGGIFESYLEYTSPTDNGETALAEIQLLYNNGWDYMYTGPSSVAAVGTAVQNYSNSGYVGYVPTP